MSVAELKEKIHAAVDTIEDETVLKAILTMTEWPIRINDEPLLDEELKMLRERKEEYQRGEAKPIPWREVQARIKKSMAFNLHLLPKAEDD